MIDFRFASVRQVFFAAILTLGVTLHVSDAAAQERGDNTLRKLNESIDALIKKVSPSIVQILVAGYGPVETTEHGNTALTLGRQRAIFEHRLIEIHKALEQIGLQEPKLSQLFDGIAGE